MRESQPVMHRNNRADIHRPWTQGADRIRLVHRTVCLLDRRNLHMAGCQRPAMDFAMSVIA